ncbi:hypothetical protein EVA_00910 [gut metagenome]|uniref:Uncharacterized protein n=1 Tax=gut metagenome TaxID=749906 RepID=J9GQI5_9ZZZZ
MTCIEFFQVSLCNDSSFFLSDFYLIKCPEVTFLHQHTNISCTFSIRSCRDLRLSTRSKNSQLVIVALSICCSHRSYSSSPTLRISYLYLIPIHLYRNNRSCSCFQFQIPSFSQFQTSFIDSTSQFFYDRKCNNLITSFQCHYKIFTFYLRRFKNLVIQRTRNAFYSATRYIFPSTFAKTHLPLSGSYTKLRKAFPVLTVFTGCFHIGFDTINDPITLFNGNDRLIDCSRFTDGKIQFITVGQFNHELTIFFFHICNQLILRIEHKSGHSQIVIQQFYLLLYQCHSIRQIIYIVFQVIECTRSNSPSHQGEKYIRFYVLHNRLVFKVILSH